jgi:hypothetical protein
VIPELHGHDPENKQTNKLFTWYPHSMHDEINLYLPKHRDKTFNTSLTFLLAVKILFLSPGLRSYHVRIDT